MCVEWKCDLCPRRVLTEWPDGGELVPPENWVGVLVLGMDYYVCPDCQKKVNKYNREREQIMREIDGSKEP